MKNHLPSQFLPRVLLCGYERGGTTHMSELFRANGFESGFDCGVLLVNEPAEMPSVQKHLVDEACRGSIEDFCDTAVSATFPDRADGSIFDKTPGYMGRMGKCLSRAPLIEKSEVIYCDLRSIFVSMAGRLWPKFGGADAIRTNLRGIRRCPLTFIL